jgi:hypothetical protein
MAAQDYIRKRITVPSCNGKIGVTLRQALIPKPCGSVSSWKVGSTGHYSYKKELRRFLFEAL